MILSFDSEAAYGLLPEIKYYKYLIVDQGVLSHLYIFFFNIRDYSHRYNDMEKNISEVEMGHLISSSHHLDTK